MDPVSSGLKLTYDDFVRFPDDGQRHFDVVFSHVDVVEPDVLYLSHERAAAVLTKAHLRGAPVSAARGPAMLMARRHVGRS